MIPPFLARSPIIALLRGLPAADALPAAQAAAAGGIAALEVTMNSPDPIGLLRSIRQELDGVAVGAGTVLSVEQARAASIAGAEFIVSPHFDREIVRFCLDRGIAVFPGAMTASEVVAAHQAGATMVKLFPAATLGPAYLRALCAPLSEVDFMVTGGIDETNLAEFFAAGARAAAV
ncbi:MAG: bifunctional 4-hydroxy-2-oxoglutarate aldolase/2-dehydro-3-deoxy-phosphogluconate aldolase, partial [Chloroflexota bacterium]|nr:bifunctional 4-hydroxy-2-oxoglutarate aldolase/2-dehydro-3-deoxy-phosphogluconate aldolase [Chloroflexota bacterium]